MFPWIEHYSRVVRNQLAHTNIPSGKKTILINTFANIDNFLFKRICNLRLVTGPQKIGPLRMFLWFKLVQALLTCSFCLVLSAWALRWNLLINNLLTVLDKNRATKSPSIKIKLNFKVKELESKKHASDIWKWVRFLLVWQISAVLCHFCTFQPQF